MKKIMIVAFITLLGAMGAQAQDNHKGDMHGKKTAEERAKHKTQVLKDSLSLTADQETQILAINLEAEKKIDAVKENHKANKENKEGIGQEIKAINMDRKEKIAALLTPEQKEKFKKMKDDRHENMKEHDGDKMHHKKSE